MNAPITTLVQAASQEAPRHASRHASRTSLAALALGVVLLLVLFHAEAAAALRVWSESTAFGHCFLVAPIAFWLAWERRDRLATLPAQPLPAAALLVLPLGLAWLAAERLGIMEGRQFAVLGMAWTLALALLGPRLAWAASVPLAYLVFLVPFGAFLVPVLQAFTARFIDAGLSVLDIPHAVDATRIEIPEGFFRVAEACAGLRFLIASVAFGALYACVIYRSPGRRLVFLGVSVVVPVLANGVRALGIVVLGHVRGSAEAGAVDHVLYGWIFFSLVILLLLLLGLPFREALMPPGLVSPGLVSPGLVSPGLVSPGLVSPGLVPPDLVSPGVGGAGTQGGRRVAGSAACVLLLAAGGPAAAALLARRAADELPREAGLVTPGFCEAGTEGHFVCDGVALVARAVVFGPHAGAGEILAAERAATLEGAAEDTETSAVTAGGVPWRMVQTHEPERVAATALWLGNAPAPRGLALRLRLARASLFGIAHPMRMVAVSASGGPTEKRALLRFVAEQRDPVSP